MCLLCRDFKKYTVTKTGISAFTLIVALLTHFFIKEGHLFIQPCANKVLNFKEVYFVNTSLSVKYIKHLKHCCFSCI